jgi:hypothetical protein
VVEAAELPHLVTLAHRLKLRIDDSSTHHQHLPLLCGDLLHLHPAAVTTTL